MRGAIREDDLGFVFGRPYGPDPHDDPDRPFWRVMHHFFDPIPPRPLTISGGCRTAFELATGEAADFRRSPDWAIGALDVFADQNAPEPGRRNHYTVFDAREAMYRALTGRNQAGDVVAATKELRNRYWATTFRALGDVVHHIQDMAQPQHTRNDAHAGVRCFGDESVYEAYVEARATGAPFTLPSGRTLTPSPLTYDGYPIPRFTDYASFFSTRNQHPVPLRQGLADYSNRGFFTAGTNIGDSANIYEFPDRNPNAYTPTQLAVNWVGEPIGGNPNARVTVLQGNVPDALPGGTNATNVPLTTRGIWDQFLEERNFFNIPRYSLNRYNYDAMADLLTPRAVAYSAGLINYFFRGRIDLDLAPGATNYVIKNYGDEAMEGTFAVYYDSEDGIRRLVPGTGPNTPWAGISLAATGPDGPGLSEVLTFAIPTNPPPAPTSDYVLVFRGRMGHETDAVAGRVVNENVYVLDGNGYVTQVNAFSSVSVDYPIPRPSSTYIPAGLSVYERTFFYNVNDGSYQYRQPGAAMAYRRDGSSIVFADIGLGNGTAVTSDRTYFTDLSDGNSAVQIKTFEHNGNPTNTFVTNSRYGGSYVDAAANATHMLTTEGGHMYIATRDGVVTAAVSGLSWFSSEAAMNSDFAYTVDGANIAIYSLSGILRQYVDLGPVSGFDIEAIDVTDDRLYVVTAESYVNPYYRLHVYKREVQRDASGDVATERFVYQRSIPFTLSARWYPLSISADRAQLRRAPK